MKKGKLLKAITEHYWSPSNAYTQICQL